MKPLTPETLNEAIKAVTSQTPRQPTTSIHHPRCPTVTSGDVGDCKCGGWAFPR